MFRGSSTSILFISRLLIKKQIDATAPIIIEATYPTRHVDELILTSPTSWQLIKVAGSNTLPSSLPKTLNKGLAITTIQAEAELARIVFVAERAELQVLP